MFLRVNCRKITFPRSGLVDVKRFVSSALVKELRALSGAPMMDCKIALQAESVNGDITKAMDFLRAKGKAKAAKGAGRVASEGLIVLYNNADKGVATLTEINSETDFVSRNKDFQSFAARVVDHVNNHFDQGTILIDELLSTQIKVDSNPISLQDSLYDIINVIRLILSNW
jgi:elongation factor Ts